MPDYKEMYFQLFRRTEQVRRLLELAQQEAEETFVAGDLPPLHLPERQGPNDS